MSNEQKGNGSENFSDLFKTFCTIGEQDKEDVATS